MSVLSNLHPIWANSPFSAAPHRTAPAVRSSGSSWPVLHCILQRLVETPLVRPRIGVWIQCGLYKMEGGYIAGTHLLKKYLKII